MLWFSTGAHKKILGCDKKKVMHLETYVQEDWILPCSPREVGARLWSGCPVSLDLYAIDMELDLPTYESVLHQLRDDLARHPLVTCRIHGSPVRDPERVMRHTFHPRLCTTAILKLLSTWLAPWLATPLCLPTSQPTGSHFAVSIRSPRGT